MSWHACTQQYILPIWKNLKLYKILICTNGLDKLLHTNRVDKWNLVTGWFYTTLREIGRSNKYKLIQCLEDKHNRTEHLKSVCNQGRVLISFWHLTLVYFKLHHFPISFCLPPVNSKGWLGVAFCFGS